jgi:8-oxo-dGTP diphosphatase
VVAVAVISDDDGAVWLIRRAIEPCVGEWALPGGYVDYDEHPSAAAARECREEIGCEVRLDGLLGVHHVAFAEGGVVVIAYSGVVVDGSPDPGPEVLEVRHFPLTALPPLAFATHRAILAELASTANATVPE